LVGQNDGQYSTLHSMPDGAFLMVSQRFEQPKQIWNLLRITYLDTSRPREDKLDANSMGTLDMIGTITF
jgi:hypothetical protein